MREQVVSQPQMPAEVRLALAMVAFSDQYHRLIDFSSATYPNRRAENHPRHRVRTCALNQTAATSAGSECSDRRDVDQSPSCRWTDHLRRLGVAGVVGPIARGNADVGRQSVAYGSSTDRPWLGVFRKRAGVIRVPLTAVGHGGRGELSESTS